MIIAVWILFSVFSTLSYGQVKVTVDTVKKGAAEKFLKGEKTEKCDLVYFFAKDDRAVSRSLCAVNMSYGGGVNETVFCELVQIDLNSGKFDSFFGAMAKFMRQSGVTGELKVKGKCSAKILDSLISETALQDIQEWSMRGFTSIVAKDSYNFKSTFEQKIDTYQTSAKKEAVEQENKDIKRAKNDPLFDCQKNSTPESCYKAGMKMINDAIYLTGPWHNGRDLVAKACKKGHEKACKELKTLKTSSDF